MTPYAIYRVNQLFRDCGSKAYILEKLIAEITSSLLCAQAQIESEVIYCFIAFQITWICKLSNDKYMIDKTTG